MPYPSLRHANFIRLQDTSIQVFASGRTETARNSYNKNLVSFAVNDDAQRTPRRGRISFQPILTKVRL